MSATTGNLDAPPRSRTRVLLTSTCYPRQPGDWQGQFIARMLTGLAARDDLSMSAWCPPGPRPANVAEALQDGDATWFSQLAERGGLAHLLRKHPVAGLLQGGQLLGRLRRACRATAADLYHINWLQCALGLPEDGKPVLLTALGTDMQLLKLPLMQGLLARRFRNRPVALCPNAEWMTPVLGQMFAGHARVQCVPFGIDQPWYDTPRLTDPDHPSRWLCVTRLTAGKLGPLFEWAEPVFRDRHRELHLIGPRQDPALTIPHWVKWHGPATPAQLRQDWFPTATGLLSLSTHPEGRPQVMLEAMAAGLPILASSNPAHLDLVDHRQTGWICRDPASFTAGLDFVEDPARNSALGANAREQAKQRFGTWADCAGRYAALYADLCR